MASSDYPEATATQLTVILPVTSKRGRTSPETEVANALKPGNNIKNICLVSQPDSQDKKRSLRNCTLVAEWLEQHGSQIEELILALNEAEESELVSSLFQCSDLCLTKLLVSAADFPSDCLQKLPATLQVFSGHLGAHGDLAPFVKLPKLQSLAVRCYPTDRYDSRFTTAEIPAALLHHPTLQCLLVDVSSTVEITDKKAMPNPVSKLKLIAITGDLSSDDVGELIHRAPKVQHLCLRSTPVAGMLDPGSGDMFIDVRSLRDLKALELGFPQCRATYLGLKELQHLSAVFLVGKFGRQKPVLPEKLPKEPDENGPEPTMGELIMRRATLPDSGGKFPISLALALPHQQLVIDPRLFLHVSNSIAA